METEMEIRASYVSDPIRITFLPAAVQRSWSPEPIIGNGNHWKLQQDTTRGRCTVVCRVGSQKGQTMSGRCTQLCPQPTRLKREIWWFFKREFQYPFMSTKELRSGSVKKRPTCLLGLLLDGVKTLLLFFFFAWRLGLVLRKILYLFKNILKVCWFSPCFIFTKFNFHGILKKYIKKIFRLNWKKLKLLHRKRYSTFIGSPFLPEFSINYGISSMHKL